jgi:hypothetical protein
MFTVMLCLGNRKYPRDAGLAEQAGGDLRDQGGHHGVLPTGHRTVGLAQAGGLHEIFLPHFSVYFAKEKIS